VQFNGAPHQVILAVRPYRVETEATAQIEDAGDRLALVFFLEDESEESYLGFVPAEGDGDPRADAAAGSESQRDAMLERLEAELQRFRERLQATTEEYESSNEELKAANEELQSINEEYRSTTEELETSKEELQSVNEELQTVNAELKNKLEEISRAHSDLENLMVSTDIATLFLDRELRIQRYTPATTDLFNIMPGDRGRPIGHLTNKLVYKGLVEDAEKVLRTLVPIEREVQDAEGRWLLGRLRPYRSVDNRIDGIVLTFVDISELKETEEALRQREAQLSSLAQSLEERVEKRSEQVRELAGRLTMAEHEERARIAQVLHDDLQQQLYSIQIQLEFLRAEASTEAMLQEIAGMEQFLLAAMETARQLSVDLSPPILEGEGLLEALQWLSSQMQQRYQLDVQIKAVGALRPMEGERRVLLFQMVRELLFNVVKHAGVKRAVVGLRVVHDPEMGASYQIDVVDEGAGLAPEKAQGPAGRGSGRGLLHIQQRLRFIGGRLELASQPGEGTRVTIFAPLPGEGDAGDWRMEEEE
jgi:two-component system CheB/CheR fusion protein